MPRRSGHNSEESPAPRRTSARIAAVQAASPAKSPVKSPRRKRQSTEQKSVSDDTESQQSQIKSDTSVEELNGIETNSSTKDRESIIDSQELPPKKAKVDETELEKIVADEKVEENFNSVGDVRAKLTDESIQPVHSAPGDFEVVEKNEVPASDSEEVKAAVSVQGEDGQLLVGFVQVNKDELPSAVNLEVQQVAAAEKTGNQPIESHQISQDEQAAPIENVEAAVTPVNGDSHESAPVTAESLPESIECGIQSKVCATNEVPVQPSSTPASGDNTVDSMEREMITQ